MSRKSLSADAGFEGLVAALGDKPGVSRPDSPEASAPRFGASALRVHGRIFAMVSRDRLVLKLPPRRVAELLGSGVGKPYDAGKGRPMKEWVCMEPASQDMWFQLASEALDFVGSKR
jgi:hypothetical protein